MTVETSLQINAKPQTRKLPSASTIAFVILVLTAPLFASHYWLMAIITPVMILSLAGIGLNIKTGYAGMVSVGAGAFMAVGAYGMFNFAAHGGITNFPLALLLGGISAAIAGYLFGLPSSRIKGFYVMVTTLAAQFFVEWLFTKNAYFYNYGSVPTITLPPMTLFDLDINGNNTIRYYVVVIIVLLMTLAAKNIIHSHVGRNWMAIRDMNTAAGVIGIDSARYKRLAFTIGSFYLGIAGALWAFLFLGTASTLSFDINRSFQVLFIIIIGGLSSIRGNFIGAAFILLLPILIDYMVKATLGSALNPGFLSNMNKVIFGSLIIILLIKEPEGFDKMLRNLTGYIKRRKS
ncbi:branched-chain amino acid ABC transporter permease [Pseudaminobacter arsenicus]|uniref:Branched-chain amino acid ABC transporter permease n=2 Tax=Borborobacter arsenicus TaxID=1851146 RepID=A0A432VCJ7_9HYPH|nr:branched-chain amino acid ABC transporter permease [Pseudaminobacter arsenicus]